VASTLLPLTAIDTFPAAHEGTRIFIVNVVGLGAVTVMVVVESLEYGNPAVWLTTTPPCSAHVISDEMN